MISQPIFITLMAISVGLLLYSLIDNENRIYGNIIAGVVSVIIAYYVAMVCLTGGIVDVSVAEGTVSETVVENASANWTNSTISYSYTQVETPSHFVSLSWFFLMFAVIDTVIVGRSVIEVVQESFEEAVA